GPDIILACKAARRAHGRRPLVARGSILARVRECPGGQGRALPDACESLANPVILRATAVRREPMRYRFLDCELDTEAHELRRAGTVQTVQPQVFDLLRLLASNPDRLISRDELIERIWGGRIVSE